jgi:hypothetical protein
MTGRPIAVEWSEPGVDQRLARLITHAHQIRLT